MVDEKVIYKILSHVYKYSGKTDVMELRKVFGENKSGLILAKITGVI